MKLQERLKRYVNRVEKKSKRFNKNMDYYDFLNIHPKSGRSIYVNGYWPLRNEYLDVEDNNEQNNDVSEIGQETTDFSGGFEGDMGGGFEGGISEQETEENPAAPEAPVTPAPEAAAPPVTGTDIAAPATETPSTDGLELPADDTPDLSVPSLSSFSTSSPSPSAPSLSPELELPSFDSEPASLPASVPATPSPITQSSPTEIVDNRTDDVDKIGQIFDKQTDLLSKLIDKLDSIVATTQQNSDDDESLTKEFNSALPSIEDFAVNRINKMDSMVTDDVVRKSLLDF